MEHNKGLIAGDFLYYLLLAFVGVSFLAGIYLIATSTTRQITSGQEMDFANMRATSIYSKLISSRDGLSTGQAGILSEDRLDAFEGEYYVDDVYTPSVIYQVVVEEIDTNNRWEIGQDLRENVSCMVERNITVAVYDGEKNVPATMSACFITIPHPLIFFSQGVAAAWNVRHDNHNFTTGFTPEESFDLYIPSGYDDRICISPDVGNDICKIFRDAKVYEGIKSIDAVRGIVRNESFYRVTDVPKRITFYGYQGNNYVRIKIEEHTRPN